MSILNRLKALFRAMFTKGKSRGEQKELPNLYGSGGGKSYVKGLKNEESQALFEAWHKKEKGEGRDGYKG